MKRVYSFICLIIGALLIGVSCNDYLDTVPDNRTALDSDEKLNELLNGSYPECHFWVVGELASDNVTDNGSRYEISYDVLQQAYGWEEITDIQYDTPFRMWDRYYFAIGAANQVIKYIEEKGSPSHLNPQLAEALLLRAYCHFNLANVFCQPYCSNNLRELGIPYVTQPETVVITKPSREQVGIVYDKINADIERALPMVSDEGLTVPQFRFNRRAAYAFAARFNLYYLPDDVIAIDEEGAVTTDPNARTERLNKAINYATEAIGQDPSPLLRDYSIYKRYTDPLDKCRAYTEPSQPCNLMLAGLPSINAYVAGLWVRARRYAYGIFVDDYEGYNSDGFWNAEDNPNWAYGTYYRTAAKVVFPKFDVFFVFTDVIAQTGRPYNIAPLFTADETLLTRAEARALLGDLDGALVDLTYWNRSHGSSPGDVTMELIRSVYGSSAQYGATKKVLTPIFNEPDIDYDSNTDKEYVIHAVLHAHRLETIYEGLRWFQIRRYGIEVEHVHEGGFPDVLSVGDLRRVFQIPGYVRGAGMTPNPRPEEEI